MKRLLPGMGSLFALVLISGICSAQAQESTDIPALYSGHEGTAAVPDEPQGPAGESLAGVIEDEGFICTTIDFEGVGDISPIPEFDGITSPDWLGIIDADAGGSGNFANEPSPETIAFWLGGPTGTGSSRDILFDKPAAVVEFFYASAVTTTLEAFDADGNLVTSVSGPANVLAGPGGDPTGDFNQWDPLRLEVNENSIVKVTVSGAINQTGIDDLKVCRRLGIDTVEFTQAIQAIQDLDELELDLAGDGEPPVPIIEGKPAVARVYFEEVQAVTTVQMDFEIVGVTSQTRNVTLQPECDRDKQRAMNQGCRSADFYFVPPSGNWTAEIRVRDSEGNDIEMKTFDVSSRSTEPLTLSAVQVCDALDILGGWQCVNDYRARLAALSVLLRKIAPTDTVNVIDSGDTVRRETSTLIMDGDGDGSIDTGEAFPWWDAVRGDIDDLFGPFDPADRRYYGMARPVIPGPILGIAAGTPSRGAVSLTTANDLGADVSQDTVAHELFHTTGRQHTNTDVPTGNAPLGSSPGCNLAIDGGTDWPYPDNRIRSGDAATNQLEVGFDVADRRPLDPNTTFDIMSYCVPVWISAFTYNGVLEDALDAPPSGGAEGVPVESLFWLLAGRVQAGTALLRPVFEIATAGLLGEGTGDYSLEVRNAAGDVLFLRRFDPSSSQTRVQAGQGDVKGDPVFSELVPVQADAASIQVKAPGGDILAEVPLTGAEPGVVITFPQGGETLSGEQTILWEVTDADSTEHVFWVQYSPDGGTLGSWRNLALGISDSKLKIDWDTLPGSSSAAVVRVIASDGTRSGSAVSGPFLVSTKSPSVEILDPPADEVYQESQLVWLQGFGFDSEEGVLEGTELTWESDLDGVLGSGSSLPVSGLTSGTHVITLSGIDGDGNTASATRTLVLAGIGPTLGLEVVPLDTLPTTCVRVTIDAQPGSVPIESAQYSLDGGASFIDIPVQELPFVFNVPGEGFFHLVARAFDEAGQLTAADERFFTDAECQLNSPPIANAGPDQIVQCAAATGTLVTLDGSGSNDLDGDPLTYMWTGPFFENGGVAEGQSVTVTFPLGVHTVFLIVNDGKVDSVADTVVITVEPVAEMCDGVDNDCDGQTDEGFDADGDGIADCFDECPFDPDNDIDGDGVCGDVDNCPSDPNPDQTDFNGDGVGDVCTPCAPEPLSQGYWHRQCLGVPANEGGIDPGRNGRGPQQPLEAEFKKQYMPTVDALLQDLVFEMGGACTGGMDADPASDKCEKARKQYSAMLFNLVSDRLQGSCAVDLSSQGCGSADLLQLVEELAGLISSGDSGNCDIAESCAAAVNEGDAFVPEALPVDLVPTYETPGRSETGTPGPLMPAHAAEAGSEVGWGDAGQSPEIEDGVQRVVLPQPAPARDTADSATGGEERVAAPKDVLESVERHLAVLHDPTAMSEGRDTAIDVLLTALGGGYEPELRLEMVKALINHVEEAYYSLLAEHVRDIQAEAEAFEKEELAEAAQKLIQRLELAAQ